MGKVNRRMNSNNPNLNPNPTLTVELVTEILLRLPVKSLLCFKRVCKSWHSLISDPQFCNSHYDLAASPSDRLLLQLNDYYAQSTDTNAPFTLRSVLGSHCNDSIPNFSYQIRSVPLPLPRVPRNYPTVFYYQIWGSCRGLIILFYPKAVDCIQWNLVLWNPSIGLYKPLPQFEYSSSTKEFLYGFGYDPSTHDYLITIITFNTGIHFFSFKTNSWNKVDINVPYSNPDEDRSKAGVFLNGALHWLLYCRERRARVIVAFDLIQRSFSEIPLFDYKSMGQYSVSDLTVMGECLSVRCSCTTRSKTLQQVVDIWVMKEYKVQSSWTKFIVIPDYDFVPICFTRDGGVFGSNYDTFEKRDHNGKRLQHVFYLPDEEFYYAAKIYYAMYRESLLFPAAVTGKTTEQQLETSEDDHQ